eukprot:TRINITY_DN11984_c0_g1_i1.p1 TRINITY_DN11984_c0_g1~~TRINITY_DN11984_c0_g1_i1.p1  ORF type:complete len:742 (+),score=142.56 TRINITY_DN11984_c0_g1_i1:39-2264(+)
MERSYLSTSTSNMSREPSLSQSISELGSVLPASLDVVVVSASGLIPMDPNGLSDPYVIIDLQPVAGPSPKSVRKNSMLKKSTASLLYTQKELPRTAMKAKTLDPVWNERFNLPLPHAYSDLKLCFTVMDHDVIGANEFQGYAEHKLPVDLFANIVVKEQAVTLHLQPREGNNQDKALYYKRKEQNKDFGRLTVKIRGRAGYDWYQLIAKQQRRLHIEGISVTVKEGKDLRLAERKNVMSVVKMTATGHGKEESFTGSTSRDIRDPVWNDVFNLKIPRAEHLDLAFTVANKDQNKFVGFSTIRLDSAALLRSLGKQVSKSIKLGPRPSNDADKADYYKLDEKIGFANISYRAWGFLEPVSPEANVSRAPTTAPSGGQQFISFPQVSQPPSQPVSQPPSQPVSQPPSQSSSQPSQLPSQPPPQLPPPIPHAMNSIDLVVPPSGTPVVPSGTPVTPKVVSRVPSAAGSANLGELQRFSSNGSSRSLRSSGRNQPSTPAKSLPGTPMAAWQARDAEAASNAQWNELVNGPRSLPRSPAKTSGTQPSRRRRTPPQDRRNGVRDSPVTTRAQESPIASPNPYAGNRWMPHEEGSFNANRRLEGAAEGLAGLRPLPQSKLDTSVVNEQLATEVSNLTKALQQQNETQKSIMALIGELSPPRDRTPQQTPPRGPVAPTLTASTPGALKTIHVDKTSGMYFTHDPSTGKSEWLTQEPYDSEESSSTSEDDEADYTPKRQVRLEVPLSQLL